MPRARILRREIVWKLDDKVIDQTTDLAFPEPNGRYRCLCNRVMSRGVFMDHFPACKREFAGEE